MVEGVLVLSLVDSVLGVSLFVVSIEPEFDPDDPDDEPYPSAYHPPPFKMKPPPREICRLAASSWQFGHVVSGGALIDCWASHS